MRIAATMYVLWAIFLIAVASYALHKMNDLSDPSSLRSSTKQLEETLDEYSKVP
jgi:hypothetical protein